MCISAQGYHNIVQNLGTNFYLKIFSVLLETKKLFIIVQTRRNDITAPKKWKNFSILLQGNHMSSEKVSSESESCSQEDKEHSEFVAKRKQISIKNILLLAVSSVV